MDIVKSKGHVCFINGDSLRPTIPTFELFHGPDGTLYGGPVSNAIVNGYRGARFECVSRADGHREYIRVMFGVEISPIFACCAEPKLRGGRCDNCGTWSEDFDRWLAEEHGYPSETRRG